MSSGRKFTVYSQANMNVIDGSSVWTQSMCLALAGVEEAEVTLLLTSGVENHLLLAPLLDHPAIEVIDPVDLGVIDGPNRLSADVAADLIASRLTSHDRQAVVVRGTAVALRFALRPELVGRMWLYLTDFPQHALDLDATRIGDLMAVAEAAQIVLCQTEEIRTFLETHFAGLDGKCWLLSPSIPEEVSRVSLEPPSAGDLSLVYAGKFARDWNTLEMCRLPQDLSARGIEATVTMIGDKINQIAADPEFGDVMREALESSPGVDWLGALSRQESLKRMARAHIGMSWRSDFLGDSLELSTKLLEYCAVATPPLLNRTPAHTDLLGADYPLFADTHAEILDRLTETVHDPSLYRAAQTAVRHVADGFTISRTTMTLSHLADLYLEIGTPESRSVLLLADAAPGAVTAFEVLRRSPGLNPALRRVDPISTDVDERRDLIDQLAGSDIVICEGSIEVALLAARHKREGQLLVYRPTRGHHGVPDLDDLRDVVDLMALHTSDERAVWMAAGWPPDRLAVVGDWVDVELLRRPKMPGARFHLGIVEDRGPAESLDLALDLLYRIRLVDRRFVLFVRSRITTLDHGVARRLDDPVLRTGVVIDDPSIGEGSWLRKIGFIVSSGGNIEAGLASGSVAVPLTRDGLDSSAAGILAAVADHDVWLGLSTSASNEAIEHNDITSVISEWTGILSTEPR